MGWGLYSLVFRLKSSLHIGYHKTLHLVRTRLYVPARTFWGALTVRLVQETGASNYEKAGQFLKEQMRFGYLYFSDGKKLFIPQYTKEGLKLEQMHLYEFEKRYVRSVSTTAIDAYSLSADEETLHHLEYINPRGMDDSSPVFLKGLLWVRLENFSEQGNDLSFRYEGIQLRLSELMQFLQIGGERKYGFGQVELSEMRKISNSKLETEEFYGEWSGEKSINVTIPKGKPVWAHVEYVPDLKMKGEIEIFMGREWNQSKGAGKNIASHGLCWVPGSIVEENTVTFEVTDLGIWKYENTTEGKL